MAETRRVIELRPPVEVNKGTAVEVLAESYGLRGAIYLGDDAPDMDAFIAIHRLAQRTCVKSLAILNDNPEIPKEVREHADYTLAGVRVAARFLRWLVQELSEPKH